jgi:quercetin dioxygenase-like cupin family protein
MSTHSKEQTDQTSEFESDGVKSEELLSSGSAWNGKAYEKYPEGKPHLTVMKMHFDANTTLPWHTHPMPNVAYIISGSLTIEDKVTGESRKFTAGEAFNESIDDIHRGYTTDEPAEVIITYAGVEGQALSEPYTS